MKKIMVFFLVITSLFGFSQKKYFKEALEKARERQAFYKVVVDNGTVVKELDIKKYAQKTFISLKTLRIKM